jgi:hypothetical protein
MKRMILGLAAGLLVPLMVLTAPAFAGNAGSNGSGFNSQGAKDAAQAAGKAAKKEHLENGGSQARAEKIGAEVAAKAEADRKKGAGDQRNGNLGVWIDNQND